MNFRKLVALIGATVIAVALVIIGLAVATFTQTDFGREQLRNVIITRVGSSLKGSMYLGRMSGGMFSGVTIDSLEIRDEQDSLFIATGPIHLRYDARDLIDGRLIFSLVTIDRPQLHIRRDTSGEWNFRHIFPRRRRVPGSASRVGQWIVLDSAVVRDGRYVLTMPWEPADSLRGARRDSAIAFNLNRDDAVIRRVPEGFARSWRWEEALVHASHVRLAHPDTIGRAFEIARMDVNEFDPPFRFRNVQASVRWAGDTIWFRAPHFDLPGSTGRGAGKIVWGSDLPVRYDVAIRGDSVSLADVAWVYPTLPRDGGGSMRLRIRNDPDDLDVIDYALSEMDVRSQSSRLRGRMTFAVGGPVLAVKDLALEASPVDLRLLRTLNGKPFPYDWAGTLTGTVRGRGGPVNRFVVDDARLTFRDAHVPGAVTRASGRGELDILFPAFATFRGFRVDVGRLDLRTPQHVNPDFPRLNGYVSGTAVLDSSWLDVRFRDASLAHYDGALPVSRFTGAGRVTLEEEFIRYDLDGTTAPLSFTTVASSYPALPLRGEYSGPLRIRGTLDALNIQASLTGAAGTLAVNGRFDLYPGRYAARGSMAVTNLDLNALLGRSDIAPTDLTARVVADIAGDSLVDLAGTVEVAVDRSTVDRLRVYDSRMRLAFGNRQMRVDTLSIETSAAMVTASGGLGLAADVRDSLRFVVHMDSLGGIRRYLLGRRSDTASARIALTDPVRDSLAGAAMLQGWLAGNVERLDVSGTLDGRSFFIAGDRIDRMTGEFRFADVLGGGRGDASFALTELMVAGIRLDSVRVAAELPRPNEARVTFSIASANGPVAVASAAVLRGRDTTTVALDRLTIDVGDHSWNLSRPATMRLTNAGLETAPVRLADPKGGWIEVAGTLPTAHEVSLTIRADSLSLADFGTLAQLPSPLDGRMRLEWRIEGHRENPTMQIAGAVRGLAYGGTSVERLEMSGRYAGRRLQDTLRLFRDGRQVMTAVTSVPVDLALVPVARRILDDSLSGWIRTDSVELGVLETFTPLLRNATGVFIANVTLDGTVRRPRATGRIAIVNGSATVPRGGLQLQRINADIALLGDGARIDRFVVQSGTERGDTATLGGFLRFADVNDPSFALSFTARNFLVVNRRSLAELQITTAARSPLTLDGRWSSARLRGSLIVDRGTMYIPDVFQKRLTDLSDPELAAMIDTAGYQTRVLLPDAPSELVENLAIEGVDIVIGDDVWLRSQETNIKLSGSVDVTRSRDARDPDEVRLALVGTLTADRGTYTLRLPPLVQRTFQVERGSIRFLGDAEVNPTLDISALHTVRQANRQDIRIRVHLAGTLREPTVELSSADGYRIDQSQLLSYLVTGAPTFETASDESAISKGFGIAFRSLGGFFSGTGVLGLDVVEVSTIGTEGFLGRRRIESGVADYLRSTRLDLGWQLSDRVFVSANTGFCNFDLAQLNQEYLEEIGLQVDYRMPRNLVLSAGTEPGNMSLICNRQGQLRGFVPTPRQFHFDLSKTWRF